MTRRRPERYVAGQFDGDPLLLSNVAGGEKVFSAYDVLDTFRPAYWSPEWETIGRDLTRPWLIDVYPLVSSISGFEAHLRAASRIFHFGLQKGIELNAESLLADRTINAFVIEGLGDVAARSRQAYRSVLRNLARVAVRRPPLWRPDPKWSRTAIVPPYSTEEIADLWSVAALQRTKLLRRFMTGWMCLALGAGLRNIETRYITGQHFREHAGVLLVTVHGARAREVPVRRDVVPRLRPMIEQYPDVPLCGDYRPDQRDPMGPVRVRLQVPAWAPTPHTERLRSTWVVTLIDESVPIQRILQYSGQSTFRFDGTIAHLADRKDKTDADLRRAAGYKK